MAKQELIITKLFTNRDEVLEKMLELGFFGGHASARDEFADKLTNSSENQHWASNGINEVKILTNPWNREQFQLVNTRGVMNEAINALFAVAR